SAFDTKTNSVTITEYPLAPDSQPWGITSGPGGVVYFTEYAGNAIGRIDEATGAIETVPLKNPGSGPRGIAVDDSGLVWIAETDGNRIGQFLALGFEQGTSFGHFAAARNSGVADFNGDGKPDIVVDNFQNGSGQTLSVLLNMTPVGGTSPVFADQQSFQIA